MRISLRTLSFLAAAALAACAAPDGITRSADDAEARLAPAPTPACVEFGPPPPFGATWGSGVGTPPGTVIFVESGIPVTIRQFLSGGVWFYGGTRIEFPPPPGVGVGQTARINNVNLDFDFTGLPFPVKTVTFEWLDIGGVENLRVDGSGVWVGELNAPPAALGGQPIVSVVTIALGGSNDQGKMQIGGAGVPVKRVWVGGQELWIDRVCANP